MSQDPEAGATLGAGLEAAGEVAPETEETDPGPGAGPGGGQDPDPDPDLDPGLGEGEATGQEVEAGEEEAEADHLVKNSDFMLEVRNLLFHNLKLQVRQTCFLICQLEIYD